MKRIAFSLFLFWYGMAAHAQRAPQKPRLVIGVVVDQMRWDYLYRFQAHYGQDGFVRLLTDGFRCEQAFINYLPSFTAPGHSCIYTGSVPSIHGIAGNDWIDVATGRHWYCTEDTTVYPLQGSRAAGSMSPRNLLSSTITDELKLATNFRSKVFGISLKDRGAILPAGHLADGAFWYDDSTGSFISSSYYGAALPTWLVNFNQKHLSDSFLRQGWTLLRPAAEYRQSVADDNVYEGRFSGERSPVFPHLAGGSARFSDLRRIPAGNAYTLAAARACIEGAALGQRAQATDFLCVSLSATDYIGHQFGPNSMEVEDTYLRLDRQLANFLRYLDRKLGKDGYLLFLTADHGAAHNAAWLQDKQMPAGNVPESSLARALRDYTEQTFKQQHLLQGIENYQVYLDESRLKQLHIERNRVVDSLRNWLYRQEGIAYVLDMKNLEDAAVPRPIVTLAVNGYNRKRSGDLLMVYEPGWYQGYSRTGTTHGTWNPYDTHIPLLWYGWHVPSGSTYRKIKMEDISATLAALLQIQMPNGCIGSVITELLP